jgi:hypothetical protein
VLDRHVVGILEHPQPQRGDLGFEAGQLKQCLGLLGGAHQVRARLSGRGDSLGDVSEATPEGMHEPVGRDRIDRHRHTSSHTR